MSSINLDDLLINKSATVKDSLKQLDKVASKILFVIDENTKLIGSLTDGDVRRWILKNGSLQEAIENVCNKNTIFSSQSEKESDLLQRMAQHNIIYSPIVNEKKQIIDIYVRKTTTGSIIIKKKKKLNIPVVIMAGGKGTRMAPFTAVLPKPLVPIDDKTILEHIINGFYLYGIKNYYFTINYRGEMIRAYFDGIKKSYKITYLKEPEFYGTAGSLTLLPENINNTFIVSNCDIIVKADYANVLKFHKETNAVLTIISSIQHQTIPYGVIEYRNGGIVNKILEKPEYSFCINTGVYILQKECLAFIKHNQVFHMTNLIEELIKAGKTVVTYPVNENEYIDIGQWEEYRNTIDRLNAKAVYEN